MEQTCCVGERRNGGQGGQQSISWSADCGSPAETTRTNIETSVMPKQVRLQVNASNKILVKTLRESDTVELGYQKCLNQVS